jgi:cell pole-organizing protein PopZ
MTQPAKVQEPSMEEILASIRRIIADDEAKPVVLDKPTGIAAPPAAMKLEAPAARVSAPKPPVMNDISPSKISTALAAVAKPAVAPPPRPAGAPPAPTVGQANGQDDIDALLNGLDEATSLEEIRPAQPAGEVFELTDDMAVPTAVEAQSSFHKIEPEDDIEFTDSAAAKPLPRSPAYDPPQAQSPPQPPILSHSTVSAVESAFNALAHTVLSNNARTLEDLVKEMLRPMLKSWLDDNLPGLVERIVKAEIERVSRGR